MREITTEAVKEAVIAALKELHFQMRPDLRQRIQSALEQEASPLGREALELLVDNVSSRLTWQWMLTRVLAPTSALCVVNLLWLYAM